MSDTHLGRRVGEVRLLPEERHRRKARQAVAEADQDLRQRRYDLLKRLNLAQNFVPLSSDQEPINPHPEQLQLLYPEDIGLGSLPKTYAFDRPFLFHPPSSTLITSNSILERLLTSTSQKSVPNQQEAEKVVVPLSEEGAILQALREVQGHRPDIEKNTVSLLHSQASEVNAGPEETESTSAGTPVDLSTRQGLTKRDRFRQLLRGRKRHMIPPRRTGFVQSGSSSQASSEDGEDTEQPLPPGRFASWRRLYRMSVNVPLFYILLGVVCILIIILFSVSLSSRRKPL